MFEEIVGSSAPLRRVLVLVSKVASTDSIVLITGETGTAKEHHVTDEEEYYDFKKDPYQLDSAVDSHPQEVGKLRERLKALGACTGAT